MANSPVATAFVASPANPHKPDPRFDFAEEWPYFPDLGDALGVERDKMLKAQV